MCQSPSLEDSRELIVHVALLLESGFASARSWVDDLVYSIDAEHLLRLRISMGSERPRFVALASEAQAACVAEARCRMEAMPAEAVIARGRIVYSVGQVGPRISGQVDEAGVLGLK